MNADKLIDYLVNNDISYISTENVVLASVVSNVAVLSEVKDAIVNLGHTIELSYTHGYEDKDGLMYVSSIVIV